MPDLQHFTLFLSAALLLAIAPGPGMIYVLTRSLAGGRREGILSSLGTFAGGMVHVLAAATGLSVILATSALAFSLVKYAGAAYLVYLGIRMILNARNIHDDAPFQIVKNTRPFWQGVATEVLNPKTALFFLSFIPQFVSGAHGHTFRQFIVLGSVSVALNTTADLLVVWFAGPIGKKLKESRRLRQRQQTGTGLAMIALGGCVALSDSH
ncbi:MAG TPA: LysE family translocator [Candidatus Angelobacter sp.]|nr:LysE family translocator [Candidatus Angelobacter sp.]